MSEKPVIGITIGDFNGIGPELILKTFSNDLIFNYCTPVIYGNTYIFKYYANLFDHTPLDFNIVRKKSDIKENQLNLRTCSKDRIEITPGAANTQAGKFALDALQLAVSDVKDGLISDIVTCPIDKKSTADAGLAFNGHTQFFADVFESDVQMILMNEDMKVSMVTGHTPLDKVPQKITKDSVLEHIRLINENLKADFDIIKPKIAVLGINPHGGDNGLMGNEELNSITPAIKEAQKENILAIGPYAPDGFFGSNNSKNFDAIVGMYHDQVLIPFKQIAFADGINYTAGLPIIRTSPDHGTAYDIAGKGVADTSSFINALYLINKVRRNRINYYDNTKESLAFKPHRREKFSIGVPDLR
jgi:4-hydroxythreonine-4-phosphate dehydrogenase